MSTSTTSASTFHTALPPEPIVVLTVEQYHQMAALGILQSGDSIELLEGCLVEKMVNSPLHAASTARVRRALTPLTPSGWSVDIEGPVTTADSEPEPDVAITRGYREHYLDRHPGVGDIGLLVEVADTSLRRDRTWKRRVYAAAGVEWYWIVNLVDRRVEVLSQPSQKSDPPNYRDTAIYHAGDKIEWYLGDTATGSVAVDDLLPLE